MTNKELHFELWHWLYKTGSEHKEDWPGWSCYQACNECFACKEAAERAPFDNPNVQCLSCPINWGTGNNRCNNINTAYIRWEYAETIQGRKELAKLIRDAWK